MRQGPQSQVRYLFMKKVIFIILTLLLIFASCTPAQESGSTSSLRTDAQTPAFTSDGGSEDVFEDASDLKIIVGDVGKADFILLACDGEYAVIDCGYKSSYTYVESVLLSEGVDKLKFVVATHPDKDHIGGMAKLLKNFPVESLYLCPLESKSDEYEKMMERASDKGVRTVTAKQNDVLTLGNARLTTYSPTQELLELDDENEASIVQMLTYGSFRMLFMGDGQFSCEGVLLNSELDLSCEVIKIAHHGSDKASSREFIERTGAGRAIISCGDTDDEKFPSDGVIRTLSELDVDIYRTDRDGGITIITNGDAVDIERGYEPDDQK